MSVWVECNECKVHMVRVENSIRDGVITAFTYKCPKCDKSIDYCDM